jgi:hypothetical protein
VTLPAGVPTIKDIKTVEYDIKWATENRDVILKKYQELIVKHDK